MEEGVQFDCCFGVSAGSANMCSYVAGQHGRNKPFYQDYSFRKEYMSVGNLVHKHSYLDLEYVYGALRMEQAGTGCVIAPDSTEGMSTLTKDKQSLEAMYRKAGRTPKSWYSGTALPKRKHKPNTTRKGLPGMGRPFLCVYDLTWITLEGESISAFPCT